MVVLSNPKTYLNARYAKGEVKEQVIRAYQLIAYIGEMDSNAGEVRFKKKELVRSLRAFRLQQSRKENMKAYYIFNDAQMEDLIRKRPKTREELLNVSGFGKVKVEKYGDKILELLNFRESMNLYQKGASIEE